MQGQLEVQKGDIAERSLVNQGLCFLNSVFRDLGSHRINWVCFPGGSILLEDLE